MKKSRNNIFIKILFIIFVVINVLLTTSQIETMETGVVEKYDKKKKHGVIVRDSDDREIFFHKDDLIDEVTSLDRVKFEVKQGSKGFYAIKIRREAQPM